MTSWPERSVGTLCTPIEQRDPRRDPARVFRYVDIASIDRKVKRIVQPPVLAGADAPSRARKVIRGGDVLVSTVRPNLNAVAMVPQELDGEIASTGFSVLRANRQVLEPRYLFYRTTSPDFVAALTSKVRGASYPAVSDRDVRSLKIRVPSLSEQRRIIALLDQANHLRQLRADADDKTARILPALFLKMFGDPITNPNGWPIKRFDEICESRLGKMLDAKQQTGSHSRFYLRNANVYWDRLALDDLLQMDFDEEDRREFRLQPGDVLICEGGEVGRAAIWNDELAECYYQKALHRARPFPHVSVPEYIVYVLWEFAKRGALRESASGATFSHLTGVKLKALRIPAPPLELQQLFGQRVRRFKQNDASSASAARLDHLFKTVRHRAFSGRLTDGWQEPLSELLTPTSLPAEST